MSIPSCIYFVWFLVECLVHNGECLNCVEAYLHGEMVEGWLPVATQLLKNEINLFHFTFHDYCWVQYYNVKYWFKYIFFFNYLTRLRRSVEWSNIMGHMVLTHIIVQIEARFDHYTIFIYYIGHYYSSSFRSSSPTSPQSPKRIRSCYHHCRRSENPSNHSSVTNVLKMICVGILGHVYLASSNVDSIRLQTRVQQRVLNQGLVP